MRSGYSALAATTMLLLAVTTGAKAEVVGKVATDWIGNDIVIEAVTDPEITGVTCHVSYFDRSLIDRLQKTKTNGDFFQSMSTGKN